MNRETLAIFLPILQAFVDGKIVQIETERGWKDLGPVIYFTESVEKYRIKPEPKYRPFNSTEMLDLVGKVIVNKKCIYKSRFVVSGCIADLCYCGHDTAHAVYLLSNFTFVDGTPCGVLES